MDYRQNVSEGKRKNNMPGLKANQAERRCISEDYYAFTPGFPALSGSMAVEAKTIISTTKNLTIKIIQLINICKLKFSTLHVWKCIARDLVSCKILCKKHMTEC